MKVRISELRLLRGHGRRELEQKICRLLQIKTKPVYEIVHRSVDARKKPDIFYVYTIDVSVDDPVKTVKRAGNRHVSLSDPKIYVFPFNHRAGSGFESPGEAERPVVAGSGPAGLFCALMLSRAGLRPIVLERGEDIEKRTASVKRFWETGELNPSSNVQFGEGGAGTFSDGKLNTSVKDPEGLIRFVLQEFVNAGADPSILWDCKPHIGTDELVHIVKHIRREIISEGGEMRFETCLTGISRSKNGMYTIELNNGEGSICSRHIILATGHSARDTYRMLYGLGFDMEAKAFAVGLRAEHSQALINKAMYGMEDPGDLPAASYKLTHKCKNGRGVYSFCMCPGGYVINASSERGMTAVNGMSLSSRGGANANSAIVVTVTPEDYKNISKDVPAALSGIFFQQKLERAAFNCADGCIPIQRFEDYQNSVPSKAPGSVMPQNRGKWEMTNIRGILPEELNQSIIEGMHAFGEKIQGFDSPDVLLSGVESRTSSPVRILRDETFQSKSHPGIYPCGEGAGYAGGITSAAIDGIRVAASVCASW